MPRGPRLTEEKKELARTKRSEGLSIAEIAKEIGCCDATIKKALNESPNAFSANIPQDARDLTKLTQALNNLEKNFPGILYDIRNGICKFNTVVEVTRY